MHKNPAEIFIVFFYPILSLLSEAVPKTQHMFFNAASLPE